MFSQVLAVTEELNREYPSARYIFVTLTIRNVRAEELSRTIDRLNEGFKNLVQKSKTMKESKIFKESLLGYIKAMEITYNRETKDYHPHIHIVFHLKSSYFGRNYIKQSQWVKIWKSMMNLDYDPLVNVKAIKKIDSGNGIVAEISKYPIKTSELMSIKDEDERNEVLAIFLTSTHHRRFVTFGGTFRDVKRKLSLDDVETGSLVHVESNDEEKMNYISYELYRYDFRYGCYIC